MRGLRCHYRWGRKSDRWEEGGEECGHSMAVSNKMSGVDGLGTTDNNACSQTTISTCSVAMSARGLAMQSGIIRAGHGCPTAYPLPTDALTANIGAVGAKPAHRAHGPPKLATRTLLHRPPCWGLPHRLTLQELLQKNRRGIRRQGHLRPLPAYPVCPPGTIYFSLRPVERMPRCAWGLQKVQYLHFFRWSCIKWSLIRW